MPIKFKDYRDYWTMYKDSPQPVTIANTGDFDKSPLPGVAIMKKLRTLVRKGDTRAMEVEGLFRVFVEYSREKNWTWIGTGKCGSPRVLDELTPPALECQAYAIALKALMITPAPFGLGIANSEAIVSLYSGNMVEGAHVGFVAHHPPSGVMNLPANVKPTVERLDESLHPDYYVWENHKVVSYGGKFFDPSYGCQFAELEDMVYLTIVGYGPEETGVDTFQKWEAKSFTDETGKYYLKCRTKQNRDYIFKVRKNSLRADGRWYEGPFRVA